MSEQDEIHSRETPPGLPRPQRFGATLRALRESYWERVGQTPAGTPSPRMRLSALSLISCLKDAGYSISSGAYSEIESGNSFPRDTGAFLKAATTCLSLSEQDLQSLHEALAYDLVAPKLGRKAESVVRRRTALGSALRAWRKRKDMSRSQLAHCLRECGFTPPRVDEEELSEIIGDLEYGDPWPLGDELRTPFVRACSKCLGAGAGRDLEEGMVDDFRAAMTSTPESAQQPDSTDEQSSR